MNKSNRIFNYITGTMTTKADDPNKILQEVQNDWLDLEGVQVVAVGEHEGKPCLDVYLSGPTEAVRDELPESYRGLPVILRDSGGEIKAL